MADITKIDSHWNDTVTPTILEQYKDSTHWKGQLKAVIDRIQDVENAAYELSTILDFDDEDNELTGSKLDWIASLANVKRSEGESDNDFYVRFKESISADTAGTPDFVIKAFQAMSGSTDSDTYYLDEAPAVFFVYTSNGAQLLRRNVKNLSPAGVLGLPGAALCFVDDGKFIGSVEDEDEYFIAVADDSIFASKKILTEDGKAITTELGLAIVTESQN